jgi:predicted DNA-binding protein (MmcQ/YjbR family)
MGPTEHHMTKRRWISVAAGTGITRHLVAGRRDPAHRDG